MQAISLSPSGRTLLTVVLAVYMLLLLGLSLFASKKVQSEEDFLVAGRRLPLFLAWGSLIATWFGAATMTGAAQAAREDGFLGVTLDPFACSATLVFAGLFFAAPLWRMKLLTTADFMRRSYGPRAEIIACCIQIPAYFGWIAAQYVALGQVQQVYFGIDLNTGILLGCLFTLVYTMVGGMWSVTLIDTLQISVAFVGLLVLGYSVFSQFGDGSAFAGIDRLRNETPPEFFVLVPPAVTAMTFAWMGNWAAGLLGNIPGQDLQQRIFAAKDAWTARAACILGGVLYLAFGMIPVAMGLMSRITDPEGASDGILQIMAGKYLSTGMAVVFVISFVSIVVSTSCSAVLAPATLLGHNLIGRTGFLKDRKLMLERLCVVFISMGGLFMAYRGKSIMTLLDYSLSIQLVALFIPIVMGLYARPRSEWCAVLAMVLGLGFFLARLLPEEFLFTVPEKGPLAGLEYGDFLKARFEGKTGAILKDLATIPAEFYGVGAALASYGVCQWIFRGRPNVNAQVLDDAWTIKDERDR